MRPLRKAAHRTSADVSSIVHIGRHCQTAIRQTGMYIQTLCINYPMCLRISLRTYSQPLVILHVYDSYPFLDISRPFKCYSFRG